MSDASVSEDTSGAEGRVSFPVFSVEELSRRGLPLYLNEAWLRGEMEKWGSLAAVAAVHDFPFDDVLRQARAFRLSGDDAPSESQEEKTPAPSVVTAAEPDSPTAPAVGGAPLVDEDPEAASEPEGAEEPVQAEPVEPAGAEPGASVDAGWLRRELKKHGTFAAVAAAHDMPAGELRGAGRRLGVKAPGKQAVKPKAERRDAPYWNAQWLRAELEKHGAYAAVARAHGFVPSTVQRAGRALGLDPAAFQSGAESLHDEAWLREQLEEYGTTSAVARAHDLPLRRVQEACRGFGINVRREYGRKRARKPALSTESISEEWLREQLALHCSVTGVASANGMRVEDLAEAVVAFEIDVQREYWEKREAALEALSEIDGEVSKVARRFMVPEWVVRHWLQGQDVGGAPFA